MKARRAVLNAEVVSNISYTDDIDLLTDSIDNLHFLWSKVNNSSKGRAST